jgi:hypothetical protein
MTPDPVSNPDPVTKLDLRTNSITDPGAGPKYDFKSGFGTVSGVGPDPVSDPDLNRIQICSSIRIQSNPDSASDTADC